MPAVEAVDSASSDEPAVLEDLMLQTEIFLQYSLRSRAAEQLARILVAVPRRGVEKREAARPVDQRRACLSGRLPRRPRESLSRRMKPSWTGLPG